MTADDTVTAKLAEWETLVRENTEGDLRADLSPIARALLGFVEDVRRLADEADAVARGHFGHEPHRPCEAFARKVLADRMRAALTKRIGGEG